MHLYHLFKNVLFLALLYFPCPTYCSSFEDSEDGPYPTYGSLEEDSEDFPSSAYCSLEDIKDTLGANRHWETYWQELCDGQHDLTIDDQWAGFLEKASVKFEGSPLLKPSMTREAFILSVVQHTKDNKSGIPGLFTFKQMLQYFPVKMLLSDDELKNLDSTLDDLQRKHPYTPMADNELPLMMMNLTGTYYTFLESGSGEVYFAAVGENNADGFFNSFRACNVEAFRKESLDLKTLANFLGDGAIDTEVDMDGNNLEGGDSSKTACILASLINRLLNNQDLMGKYEFDEESLHKDMNLLLQAASIYGFARACTEYENPPKVFEDAILEQLRMLPEGDQILLATGFTKHAMAMSVKRIDNIHYELLIFNSGAGLEHHMSYKAGSKTRVIPAKRFSNLTRMNLKWSQVFKRIYYIYAMSYEIFIDPQEKQPITTTASDFYTNALGGLLRFEREFKAGEIGSFLRVFSFQRSGVCSVEVFMAFLAFDMSRPYQKLKLFLYKDLIELASGKVWPEIEIPIFNRVLKYGIENHARAVLRFLERGNNIPVEYLLPKDLWGIYGRVKSAYVLPHPEVFSAVTDSLIQPTKFHEQLMRDALEINSYFKNSLQSNKNITFSLPSECHDHIKLVSEGPNPSNFVNYLGALPAFIRNCRLRTDNLEEKIFFAFTVVRDWPAPDNNIWTNILSPENNDHENNLKALWNFSMKIIQSQSENDKKSLYLYTCMHKIMMIHQFVLDKSLPGISRCLPDQWDRSSSYLCLSQSIVEYFQLLDMRAYENCFNDDGTYLKKSVLAGHLESLAQLHSSSYSSYDLKFRPKAVPRLRLNDNIPASLYYWYVLRKIVAKMRDNRIVMTNFDRNYSPLNDRKDQNPNLHPDFNTISQNQIYFAGGWRANFTTPDSVQISFHHMYLEIEKDPKQRFSSVIKDGDYDQLGKYCHLLLMHPEVFDWSMTLHLGAMATNCPSPKDSLGNVILTINKIIGESLDEINKTTDHLYKAAIYSPEMKSKCELVSALVIIESIVSDKMKKHDNLKTHLKVLAVFLDDPKVDVSYQAMFSFAYLASLPVIHLDDDEIAIAFLVFQKYKSDLKDHIPDKEDFERYHDHIHANIIGLFYRLVRKPVDEQQIAVKNILKKVFNEGGHEQNEGGSMEIGISTTTLQTDKGRYFDLISGAIFIPGANIVKLNPEDLFQYYSRAGILEDPSKLKLHSLQHQFRASSELILGEVLSGSKLVTRKDVVYDLQELQILILGKESVYIREGYRVCGEMRYAIRLSSKKYSMAQIPIPAIINDNAPYNILAYPKNREMAFILGSEEIWVDSDGLLTFQDPTLANLRYLPFDEDGFKSPLASYQDGIAFRASNGSYRLLFRNYADANGNPLWFTNSSGSWNLLGDPKLSIALNQNFSTVGMLPKYLLLQGDPHVYKALLPIENYRIKISGVNELENSVYWDDQYGHLRKRCTIISMAHGVQSFDEAGYLDKMVSNSGETKTHISVLIPQPKSRQESLLLLYNYLVTRNYHQAMKEADGIHQMEPFDGEEFRLLGWILQSHEDTKNGSPESIAIRGFTSFLIFNNTMLFHSLGRNNESPKIDCPYDSDNKWKAYLSENYLQIAGKSISLYIDRLSKVPYFFQFHAEARLNRINQTQWQTWLEVINDAFVSSHLIAYMQHPENESLQRPEYIHTGDSVESLELYDDNPYEIRTNEKAKFLLRTSLIKPNILTAIHNGEVLAKILAYKTSTELREEMDQWLQPFESTCEFSEVARTLRDALSLTKKQVYEFIQYEYSDLSKWTDFQNQLLEASKQLRLSATNYSSKADEDRMFSSPDRNRKRLQKSSSKGIHNEQLRFQEKTPACLTTEADLDDLVFGVTFPLIKIKESFCKGQDPGKHIDQFFTQLARSSYFEGHLNDLPRLDQLFAFDLNQKLKIIQQLLKLYKLNRFASLVSRAYPKSSATNNDLKGLHTIAYGQINITTSDIIHMYAKAQPEYYKRYFPYFEGNFQELHNLATEIVLVHSNWQEVRRLRRLLKSFDWQEMRGLIKEYENKNGDSTPGQNFEDFNRVKIFKQETCDRTRHTASDTNNMLAYECYINSRLTKKQVDDLKTLTTKTKDGRYPDMFLQWIMSAGKTYILGTLLSVMKADLEKNLSILVVPKSLLTGEAANLFSRTIAAFNRDGFSFQLARDPTLADLKTIRWIKEAISNALNRGQYIIMSADMMESLHDKFVELGIERNSHPREYEEMQQLLKLVLDHGAMTVDEAHKIFDPTQETNFPIASSKVDASDPTAELVLEGHTLSRVFQFLVQKWHMNLGKRITKNTPIDLRGDAKDVSDKVGKCLVEDMLEFYKGSSFLESRLSSDDFDALERIKHDQSLLTFLTTESISLDPSQLKSILSPDLYDTLAVCRLAVTSLIPLAWSGNVNENYGLEPGKRYSIPFSAAFAPKIGSEFAFRWYCYGRTIRTYIVNGFDAETIKWALTWLQKWALKEMMIKSKRKSSKLPEKILKLFGLASPYELNLQSEEQTGKILKLCIGYHKDFVEFVDRPNTKLYSEFLFRWIAEDVIPSIEYYSKQISTNSQDVSYMVNSRQLYSGSVVSTRTFPRTFLDSNKLHLDDNIDKQIRQAVKDHTFGVSIIPDGLSADAFMKANIFKDAKRKIWKEGSPIVAVLDVGAYFKDQRNEQVAASLLEIQNSVLYFSTDKNKLALITNDDPNEKLIHPYSAEIIRELISDEGERITFYDQQHNIGIDIFQHVSGCALIIIGAKTTSIDFYQSVMRMRKFLESQRLFIFVPEHVSKIIPRTNISSSDPDVEDILKFMEKNLEDSVINLNSMALSQMIGAIFKEAAYKKLLRGEINDQEVFDLWIKDTSSDIKKLIVRQEPRNYANQVVPSIINSYMTRTRKYFNKQERKQLRQLAKETVVAALGGKSENYYPTEVLCNVSFAGGNGDNLFTDLDNMDTDMLAIVSAEAEEEVNTQQENENVQENYVVPYDKLKVTQIDWTMDRMPMANTDQGFSRDLVDGNPGLFRVNEISPLYREYGELGSKPIIPLFSDSLLMSTGFVKRHSVFGAYRGVVSHCLVLSKGDELYVVIVDQFEAEDISRIITKGNQGKLNVFGYNAALVDPVRRTVDTGGHDWIGKLDLLKRIDSLLVQVGFFAGYLRFLAEKAVQLPLFRFLGEDPNGKAFKAALLTDVIVTKDEYEVCEDIFPENKTFVEYAQIPEDHYKACQAGHELALFNFLSRNRKKLNDYMARLKADVQLYHFDDLIENNGRHLIISDDDLFEALGVALGRFLDEPALRAREDFERNLAAVGRLLDKYEERVLPLVARAALKILHGCQDDAQAWKPTAFEGLLLEVPGRIAGYQKRNPDAEWIMAYGKSLASLPNAELCPGVAAFLAPPAVGGEQEEEERGRRRSSSGAGIRLPGQRLTSMPSFA